MEVLTKPLTIGEIKERCDEDNYITGNILVSLSEAIDNDLEGWLDILSEGLTNNPCLMDINYELKGVKGGQMIIEVTGDVSSILEMEE